MWIVIVFLTKDLDKIRQYQEGAVYMVYLIVTLRILSIMALLLFLVLKTGRRKIGELPVFDFLTLIILGSIVGADIADPEIEHLPTAYAIVLLVLTQYLISHLVIKNRKVGSIVTFGPTVIIQKGQFVKSNLERLNYSIENVLMYLREKDIFDINEVDYAIVEDSGNISVLKKAQYLPTNSKGLSLPLVVEGEIYEKNLKHINKTNKWLMAQLKNYNVNSLSEVFYAEVNSEGNIYVSKGVEPEEIKQV